MESKASACTAQTRSRFNRGQTAELTFYYCLFLLAVEIQYSNQLILNLVCLLTFHLIT